jgi:uncharacterized protein involved in copper resistance
MLKTLSTVALAIGLPAAAFAQAAQAPADKPAQTQTCADHSKMAGMDHMKMDQSQMAGMDMSGMNMSGMDHSKMAAMDHSKMMGSCATPKAGATSEHQGHSSH